MVLCRSVACCLCNRAMVEIRITYSYAYVQIIAQLLSERLIPFVALDVRRYELSFLPVRSVCVRLEI